MTKTITKDAVMEEIYAIACEKSKQQAKFYLHETTTSMTARQFYAYIYREIEKNLANVFDVPDFLDEYFSGFCCAKALAKTLMADYEKECVKKTIDI